MWAIRISLFWGLMVAGLSCKPAPRESRNSVTTDSSVAGGSAPVADDANKDRIQPDREPTKEEVEAAVKRLQTLTLEKDGFVLMMGEPGLAVKHTEETNAVVAKGSATVPYLLKRLESADYDEAAFIVFCLHGVQAKSAKKAIRELDQALKEKRRFAWVQSDIALRRELYVFLRDCDSWK